MNAAPNAGEFSAEITAINLHRIWWTLIASTGLNIAILAFNLASPSLHNPVLAGGQILDVAISAALLALTRRLQTHPVRPGWRHGLIAGYLLLALAFMDAYYFILLRSHGHTAAYVLGVITMGVLLVLPPRLFISLLLANHAVFCALLLSTGQGARASVLGVADGTCAVLVAGLAAWFLYRAKQNDFLQQRVIADRNHELQLRNEEMGEVMAITAHDLRSPLQGVKHLLDFAAPLGGAERMVTALRLASRSCGEMLALIGRLLEAHGEGGEISVEDLRGHLNSAALRAQPLAAGKNIGIECRLPPNAAQALVEAGAIAQVLDNLIGNAIKFSPSGTGVTLALFEDTGAWWIEVRDEGPGVAEPEREAIFRKFQRSGDGGEAGSGLGLFIVRKLMESMSGSVVCNPREGGGAVFRLRFAPAEGVV